MTMSSPFFRFHLLFWNSQLVYHESLGEFNELVRTAGVENRVGAIMNLFLDPGGINAPAPSRPLIRFVEARAGHVEIKVGVLQSQLTKLILEDDVVSRAHAVKNRDARGELANR